VTAPAVITRARQLDTEYDASVVVAPRFLDIHTCAGSIAKGLADECLTRHLRTKQLLVLDLFLGPFTTTIAT
jgi:hypothetical protein